jgi:D-inositol-3-phosphate glycosyltransferase
VTPLQRIAMLSVHTSPLATLGGEKAGGMNVYVRDLGRELGKRGFEVDIFTRRQEKRTPTVVPLGDTVRVIHVSAGPPIPLGTGKIYPYLPDFAAEVLRSGPPYDVIFSHYWLSGWVAHELRASWAAPVVVMFHTLGRMKDRIAQGENEREAALRIFVETDIMSWADRLIAATPAERAQMLWLYRADRRKIEVVPPGVDLERFRPIPAVEAKQEIGLPDHRRMLLFVGRLEPLKGVDTILEALTFLRDDRPTLFADLCLYIIGGDLETPLPDAEINRLKRLCHELGLHDTVSFLGARDQDSLEYYYSAAEVLIMPSDYESFGMVALEAMACGTPVIASEIGGLAYLVQDGVNGFHVPTREPAQLADRIRIILTEPERAVQMGNTARRMAQAYSWPLIADRIIEIFESARLAAV